MECAVTQRSTEETKLIPSCAHSIDDLKKVELEQRLDEYLSQHSARFTSDAQLAGYFTSRARLTGSPVKREAPELKVARARRHTKASDEILATGDE